MNDISAEQKLLAIAAHISYFLGGLGFIAAPLIILLLKKDAPFVYNHAKQALVAHMVLLIAGSIVGLLSMILIGLLFVPVIVLLGIGLIITSIIASIKALNGEHYRYPLIQGIVNRL